MGYSERSFQCGEVLVLSVYFDLSLAVFSLKLENTGQNEGQVTFKKTVPHNFQMS